MFYYRARWYDPQARRFISEDPIGLKGGINPYAYVSNNPINYTDPLGLWTVSIEGYFGWGGGIVFGKNPNGGRFISWRLGYGLGAGVSYNPKGKSPGKCESGQLNIGAGLYGQAAVGLGPAYAGISGNAGVEVAPEGNRRRNHTINPATQNNNTGFTSYSDIGPEYGLDYGWHLRGSAAVGVELTIK